MGKKKRISKEKVLESMLEMTGGAVNDAVKLAYLTDKQVEEIARLDLSSLTEFKRGSNGTVEIKFIDRIRILERVIELLGEGEGSAAEQFLRALEGGGEGEP